MEKRLFAAIILSLLVLYAWVGITQPLRKSSPNRAQHIGNKEVIDNGAPAAVSPPELPPAAPHESFITIENPELVLTFSSKGAAITEAHIKDFGVTLPVRTMGIPVEYENAIFNVEQPSNRVIQFDYQAGDHRIYVIYELSKDEYVINQTVKFEGLGEMSKLDEVSIRGVTLDVSRLDIEHQNQDFNRDKALFEYAVNSYSGILRKNNAYKFEPKEEKRITGHVVWVGFRDRYYCAIFRPKFESQGYSIKYRNSETLDIDVNIGATGGRSVQFSSLIFIGPEKYDVLRGYALDMEKIKRFYRFGLFDIIAMVIYHLMEWIHKIFPNWGVAIILVSSLIYASMYPLTLKGMSSMKRMQALQPEVNKIRDKYQDNPQKMNQEMMRLYKENKINPLGGCLPLLLQMPIFIGLYQVLWRSVTFKGASFLWIKDLSQPDHFYTLPFSLPFIGRDVNLLPILMMIIMFFQQRISAKNMIISDPMQAQQQKMMGIFMPVMLGVIFYRFASGLTLYFTIFYLFSTFTQLHMYAGKKAKT